MLPSTSPRWTCSCFGGFGALRIAAWARAGTRFCRDCGVAACTAPGVMTQHHPDRNAMKRHFFIRAPNFGLGLPKSFSFEFRNACVTDDIVYRRQNASKLVPAEAWSPKPGADLSS